ncbi:MAG TPA: riboflavin biosynthesis protein RibF [Bacteroidota bacterium]|nr:riboflavin biosynthesis protein RibF [Bacteroidota bacterium]
MKIVRSLPELSHNKDSVISIGTFDGVHLAHQKIIREVIQRAQERSGRSVIITFDPHPKEVVGKQSGDNERGRVQLLTTNEEKLELIANLGVDVTFVVPFTYEFSRKPFREFYTEYIINGVGVSEVIEGYDHGFGKDREAGLAQLLALGREFGFSVVAEKQFFSNNELVSSSRIRSLLMEGEVGKANTLLGRRFGFSGTVVAGDGRGRTLGFPTANIDVQDPRKILPGKGVYAVKVHVDGMQHNALMSIGTLPTFYENHDAVCEVFIYEFAQNIYGRTITVECVQKIRGEKKFSSPEDLVKEMNNDKHVGKNILENVQ